jgi:hypothetical protein
MAEFTLETETRLKLGTRLIYKSGYRVSRFTFSVQTDGQINETNKAFSSKEKQELELSR